MGIAPRHAVRAFACVAVAAVAASAVIAAVAAPALAQDRSVYPEMPPGTPPVAAVADADAKSAAEMKPYREVVPGCDVTFGLVPIPAGRFTMGSPEAEPDRNEDEGPQHEVAVAPFWMGRCEVTWDEYYVFMQKLDLNLRKQGQGALAPQDAWADAVSRPTPPYVPMDFGYGVKGNPAICMTQFAARHYTKWLSMKTGRSYRLPTEAEWEYACRAGTTTTWSFGDDVKQLGDHAWYFDNSDSKPHPVGARKPNPWGLFDMHGNVAEWTLDKHDKKHYATFSGPTEDPVCWPADQYPHVVRGGSWDDDPDRLRSAARRGSDKSWKVQDPQLPKSIWYLTDARFVGFRVVRPLREPTDDEKRRWWEPGVEQVAEILDKQRKGGR